MSKDISAAPVSGQGVSVPVPSHPDQKAQAEWEACIALDRDSRPRSEDSRAKAPRDPARWYVWHNNQEVEGANLMEVFRNGKSLRTEEEALVAAQNVMAALEQERLEEMMKRARKEHPECFDADDKLAALASTPPKAENE